MQKILVPVDGSDNALRAVRHAIAAANSNPMIELHLLHVLESMPTHVHAYFSVDDIKKIEAGATAEILQPATRLCDEAAAPYVSHARVGAIAPTNCSAMPSSWAPAA